MSLFSLLMPTHAQITAAPAIRRELTDAATRPVRPARLAGSIFEHASQQLAALECADPNLAIQIKVVMDMIDEQDWDAAHLACESLTLAVRARQLDSRADAAGVMKG